MISKLPVEIINLILHFEGSLKYRNGKWMDPLNVSKEIKEKISKCIKRKYNSIDPYRGIVIWTVEIHTCKRMALYIRKESIYIIQNEECRFDEYVGNYRIITYKPTICHSGEMTYTNMLIDDIDTYSVIW
jgi:hypothetical protein